MIHRHAAPAGLLLATAPAKALATAQTPPDTPYGDKRPSPTTLGGLLDLCATATSSGRHDQEHGVRVGCSAAWWILDPAERRPPPGSSACPTRRSPGNRPATGSWSGHRPIPGSNPGRPPSGSTGSRPRPFPAPPPRPPRFRHRWRHPARPLRPWPGRRPTGARTCSRAPSPTGRYPRPRTSRLARRRRSAAPSPAAPPGPRARVDWHERSRSGAW